MLKPLEFLRQYQNLTVNYVQETGQMCRQTHAAATIRKYFLMKWKDGTEERSDFNHVTSGGKKSSFFQEHRQQILNAAMGKGAPREYELALEWAIISGKIAAPTQATIQAFADERLGIDCSGFVTNYLMAAGLRPASATAAANTNAASYYNPARAVNDANNIRQGDLLVWMKGNSVKTNPGHIAVVESYRPICSPSGNMRVCEATGADGANPKLLDSMYSVEQIIPKGGAVPAMILVVRRHGVSGHRVVVIRP